MSKSELSDSISLVVSSKRFIVVNESYTSKICSSCGDLNMNENKSKIFRCNKCPNKIDRDYNGARNIYLLGTVYK